MIRIRCSVIGILALVLLTPFAMAQCELFEPQVQCRARLQAQQAAQWQHAFEEWEKGMKSRAEYEQRMADARARFWATYPDKPGAQQAQTEFANYLRQKDLSLLRDYLAASAMTNETGGRSSTDAMKAMTTLFAGHPLDGGIRQSAMPEFEAWANAVRAKVFEGHTSNSTDDEFLRGFLSAGVTPSFFKALESTEKLYKAYLIARDWWEFDNAKRLPAGFDSPDAYGTLLYYRWEKIPMPQAGSVYQTFARLVGAEAARAAAKQVRDAPKDAQGLLVVTAKPPVKTGPGGSQVTDYDVPMPDNVIGTWASPVKAMEILATRGNARTYLLFLLREQNENGTRIDRATQWTFAETAYNRLKLAFGEAAVLDAAERVRTAKKRMTSNTIMNQEAIGATRNAPTEAFEDILARKDPAGFVKIALLFSGNIDSALALNDAYRKFVADHGEANVLAAAKRIAAGKPYFFYNGGKGALENEMSLPTPSTVAPAAAGDSPTYLAWRDFPPGAKATYVDLKPGTVEPVPANVLDRQTYQLRSISGNDARVWVTQVVYDPNGKAHPPRDSEEVYPAKAAPVTPVKTGSDTLTIKGKPMATRWEQTENQSRSCTVTKTIWRNDEVPGSVVRDRTDTACPGRTFVQDKWLESYEGARTRPAAPAVSVASASAAPSLPAPPDRSAQRSAPQPSVIATMSDEEIARSRLNGFLPVVTLDTINLDQIKAGQTVRARLDISSQLKYLVPAEAARLQSVINDVEIRVKFTLAGLVVGAPRLNATVGSVSFRGQDIPVSTYDRSQFPTLNNKLAQRFRGAGNRGPTPDSYWEVPANTAMTLTTTNLRTSPDTNQATPVASLPRSPVASAGNDRLDPAQRRRNGVSQPPPAPEPPQAAAPAAAPPATAAPVIPPGTRIQATLLEPVDMAHAGDGDTFRAQTLGPITLPGGNVLPQGAAITLRFSRSAAPNMARIPNVPPFVSVGLALQSITLNGQALPVSSNVVSRILPAGATAGVRATYPSGMSLMFIVSGGR